MASHSLRGMVNKTPPDGCRAQTRFRKATSRFDSPKIRRSFLTGQQVLWNYLCRRHHGGESQNPGLFAAFGVFVRHTGAATTRTSELATNIRTRNKLLKRHLPDRQLDAVLSFRGLLLHVLRQER